MAEIDNTSIYTQLGLNKTESTTTQKNDELGQSDFLELMTAQLQFQDPLNPMENGDFLAQMAQFGTVSGITDLNTAFSDMTTALQSSQALQASTMVGRDVLVPGTEATLQETGDVSMAVDLDESATQVIISVTDEQGQLVHRIDLGDQQAGFLDITWNGTGSDGERLAAGQYTFTAEIHQGDTVTTGEMLVQAKVESVTLGQSGDDLTLTVSGIGDIGMSDIRKIM